MSRSSKPPRVVAELGRPETPAEIAARKAENSRLYRQRKTINNLVFSLLATVGVAAVIVLMVPRGDVGELTDVDVPAAAAQVQVGESELLAVPELPAGWRANAAELRTDASGLPYWYVGLLSPKDGYVGLNQALPPAASTGGTTDPADIEEWIGGQLDDTPATGTDTIQGVEWTVYDRRESASDPGNTPYALSTTRGESTYLVFGTADLDEILQVVTAITPQLGLQE